MTSEPKKVIVFIVGGATYEEARIARDFTAIDLIIGGTTIHNMDSYTTHEIMEQ